jgi:hypothetical protein
MATTPSGRWPIWTDGGTGSATAGTAGPATWVYRLADGTYLTVGADGAGGTVEVPSPDRPLSPDGHVIPPAWYRLAVKLPPGPATDALVGDVEAAGGRPDPDLLWRLATAVAAHADAPALLVATDVKVECDRGWARRTGKARHVEVRVTYYL